MSLVKKELIREVQELALVSRKYSDLIKNAKTNAKKEFYSKRLKKNNNKVANILQAIDRLDKDKERRHANADPEG
jgi:hypothetical protein